MFRYFKDGKPLKFAELFEKFSVPTEKDWRLGDQIGCAENEAFRRKGFKLFEFEGDKYEVEWFEYIPECLKKLGYTRYMWESGGWFWYHGNAEKPLYINTRACTFKFGSESEYQLPITMELCRAMLEYFEGLK